MSLSTLIKSIQDIMRQDAGVDGDAQRISQIIKAFGGKPAYLGAIRELERGLYQQAAN